MKHVVIVGGVAGGMATAARLRRLSEETNITVVERTEYISYATCGMPYYIEGKINDRSRMFVKTPEEMSKLFRVNIKTNTEAISIDRDNKKLWVRDLKLNKEYYIDYDKLVLSTGAEPYVPDIEGVDISEVYKLRNISDMDRIKSNILESKPKKAVIVGGGFIGIEMAEALRYQGLEVSLVELDKQVMTHFDREMATFIHQNLVFNGIKLFLNNSVEKFEKDNNEIKIFLKNGEVINSDIVILSLGVRPDTSLAEKSNLETGLKKAIIVNEKMLTSDPDIYAIGDAVELKDYISQNKTLMPLAGIANRQGRVVAENIAGLEKIFKKPLGTSICKVFDMTIASTGLNEKQLKKYGYDYNKVYLHPANHAGYYPDSFPMTIKLLFENKTGKILGAQIIGNDGVDKRIDTISTAIYSKLTVYDLQDIEFAYAPPYNSVKDPVNIAGNIAVNMLNNILSSINPDELDNINKENTTIINVSEKEEHANANIENSICIPLIELRDSLSQIDKNKLIITYCQMGLRGYIAYRILKENGFNVKNLVGGFKLYKAFKEMDLLDNHQLGIQNKLEEPFCSSPTKESVKMITNLELDACGLQCPGPILKLKETLGKMNNEETVKVI
ncbi:MAG: FAD-dependent oxidoreductase, partial [Cyanobacteriota bacterium]